MAGNEFSMRRVQGRPNKERKSNHMKNRNNIFTATLVALAFALGPGADAQPRPDGGPTPNLQGPLVTIHSTGDVKRGEIGTFVLRMGTTPTRLLGGMYVKFSVSGTAIPTVDYVALVSPVYIGQSGYAVILVKTLPDPRGLGSSINRAYSVVITLEDGAGYALGQPASATMWIKP
jgi:hypothetical protein